MSVPQNVVGNGPVKAIAMHGWFGCAATGWGAYKDLIDPEKYSIALMDHRGYGDRMDDAGPYTIEQIADDALELADALGWDRFVAIGHSMSGVAIQKIYQLAPDRVTAMIGVDPVHCTPFPWDDDSWKLFDDAAQEDGNRFGIIDFTTGNRNTATWVNKMVASNLATSTREAFGAYLPSWGKADFASDLPNPEQAKVTLIVGEHDPALGAGFMKDSWLVTYPQANLEIVANAGHYPMHEAPVNFTTLMEKALDAS